MADVTPGPVAVRLVKVTRRELVAVIDFEDGTDVRVRHQPARPDPWRCTRCGSQHRPTCRHARAVDLTTQAHEVLTDTEPHDTPTDPRPQPVAGIAPPTQGD